MKNIKFDPIQRGWFYTKDGLQLAYIDLDLGFHMIESGPDNLDWIIIRSEMYQYVAKHYRDILLTTALTVGAVLPK